MKKLASLFLLLALTGTSAFAEEIWFVSAKENSNTELTVDQVKEVFLGKPQRSSDGTELVAIDRKSFSEEIRTKLYKTILGMSRIQLKAFWSQKIFTGHGYPPQSAEDLAALKKLLKEEPNSISFVLPNEFDSTMKIRLKVEI